MTDFDRENGPTLGDLLHSRKIKLIAAAVLFVAVAAMLYLDITGQVVNWR